MTLTEFLLARIAEDEADFSTYARDRGWSDEFTDRMLAECEAKRRIVELAQNVWEDMGVGDPYEEAKVYRKVLPLLALPYAEHPDYRDEWRP